MPAGHPDEPALDILAAVLGGLDKENRLFRALMYDRTIAASVGAEHPTHHLSGEFEVELYAHPDKDLAELVKLADAEIERLKQYGPTESEVRKAQNERESELIMGLQSVTRKAEVLNLYQALYGDPLAYRAEIDRVFAVTVDDLRRVARQVPRPEPDRARHRTRRAGGPVADRPAAQARTPNRGPAPVVRPPEIRDEFDRSEMPPLGPTPRYRPPGFQRRRLSNGLELRIVERHELPIVTVNLVIKSGETLTPRGKEGLASLAAELLEEGTTSRDTMQLAGELAEIGSTLTASGRPGVNHGQPDDPVATPGARPRPFRRRREASGLPREGAGAAAPPAALAPEGTSR